MVRTFPKSLLKKAKKEKSYLFPAYLCLIIINSIQFKGMTLDEQLSNICTQCGMCCDGTLFQTANLKDEPDQNLAQDLGLSTVHTTEGKRFFKQPCHHFNHCCTIYDQTRPHVCGSYFCKPLKKFKKGAISFEEAQRIIQAALSLRAEIQTLIQNDTLLAGYTIPELMDLCLPKPSDEIKKRPVILIKIIALNVVLKNIRDNKISS